MKNMKQIQLFYGWQETEEGVFHAFLTEEVDTKVNDAEMKAKLAEMLDTTPGDQRFNWNVMPIALPEGLVEAIKAQGVKEQQERMKGAYTILQLPVEDEGCFRSFDEQKSPMKRSRYTEEYIGTLPEEVRDMTDGDKLECLFVILNSANRPADYRLRSLSVSDVVILGHGDSKKAYFCNSYGWKEIQFEED